MKADRHLGAQHGYMARHSWDISVEQSRSSNLVLVHPLQLSPHDAQLTLPVLVHSFRPSTVDTSLPESYFLHIVLDHIRVAALGPYNLLGRPCVYHHHPRYCRHTQLRYCQSAQHGHLGTQGHGHRSGSVNTWHHRRRCSAPDTNFCNRSPQPLENAKTWRIAHLHGGRTVSLF